MSIYGSLTTAVTGLNAQARALGAISDNIANAQTIGYKRVNSAFQTMVLASDARLHAPGGVLQRPIFVNNIQGNLTQVQSPTNVSIQGQGFFSVSKLSKGLTGPGQKGETVQTQTGTLNAENVYYTRAGDFELDNNRYLVNSAGFALNGWLVDPLSGQLNKDVVQPIQVNTLIDRPEATKRIDFAANLPATPTPGVRLPTSSIQVFDTQGNPRTINMNWRQQGANDWRLMMDAPGSSTQPVSGSFDGYPATVTFGQNIVGVTAMAQRNTVTIGGGTTNGQAQLRIGEKFKLTVDGVTYTTEVTSENVALMNTYTGLAGVMANNINSASPSPPIIASTSGGRTITFTAKDAGKPFKISQEVEKRTPVTNTVNRGNVTNATTSAGQIQRFNFPQSQIDIGDSWNFNVQIGATTTAFNLTVTAQNYSTYLNSAGVVEGIANKINAAGIGVTATAQGGTLMIQHNTANTSFTVLDSASSNTGTAFVTNAGSESNNAIIGLSQVNVPGIRQQQTVTLTGTPGDVGTQYTISVNNSPITYTTTGEEMTMAEITAALANKINSNTSLPVTATSSGGVIQLVAKVAVTPGEQNDIVTGPGANDLSLTGAHVDIGDTYAVTDGTTTYSLTISATNYSLYGSPTKVMQYFADRITAAGGTASASGAVLTAAGWSKSLVSNAEAQQFSLQQTPVARGQTPAHINLTFGTTPESVGTLTRISTANVGGGTSITAANQAAGSDATVTFSVNYGFGPQQITLAIGQFQRPGGLTQFAGSEMNITQFVQDGVQRGQFKDVVFGENGEVMVNYDNGRAKMVARVPVVTFNNPNALQRDAGGVFVETEDAGKPNFNDAGQNGSGEVISNSIEGSNVDIADEFTKLIITQRTYSANTKIVTTSDEMLQEVLGLKR